MGSNPIQIDSQGYMELTSSTYDNVGNSVMTGTTNLLNILISFLPIMVGIFVTWLIIKRGIPFLANLFHLVRIGGNQYNNEYGEYAGGSSVLHEHITYDKDGKQVVTKTIDKTKKGGFYDFS